MCTRRDEARAVGATGEWKDCFTVALQVVKSQVMFNLVGHTGKNVQFIVSRVGSHWSLM